MKKVRTIKKEKDFEKNQQEAIDRCPTNQIACTQGARNSESWVAEYTVFGGDLTFRANDTIKHQGGGIYYVDVDTVNNARKKVDKKTTETTTQKEARQKEARQVKIRLAKKIGSRILLRKYMTTECTEQLNDCSFDVARVYINPDGTETIKYTHCY